jgi:hypothetical protein
MARAGSSRLQSAHPGKISNQRADWTVLDLWRTFGREELGRVLDEVDMSKLSATQTQAMEAWRYWLSGDETDLVGRFEKYSFNYLPKSRLCCGAFASGLLCV